MPYYSPRLPSIILRRSLSAASLSPQKPYSRPRFDVILVSMPLPWISCQPLLSPIWICAAPCREWNSGGRGHSQTACSAPFVPRSLNTVKPSPALDWTTVLRSPGHFPDVSWFQDPDPASSSPLHFSPSAGLAIPELTSVFKTALHTGCTCTKQPCFHPGSV